MIIDGEKWACEACVRGHRVSSCHHSGMFFLLCLLVSSSLRLIATDRPLTHINKKGRPVSQCAHCRGLRKSRTTHTKCECGEKKKNCHKNETDFHAADRRDLKREHVGDGTLVHNSDLNYRGFPSAMWLLSWPALYLCAEKRTPSRSRSGNWPSSFSTFDPG